MTLHSRLLPILLVPLLAAPCFALAAPTYTVTVLVNDTGAPNNPPDDPMGIISHMNNWGQSVGTGFSPGDKSGDATVWVNGVTRYLQLRDSVPAGGYAQGLAINDSGTVLAQSCGAITCNLVTIANGKVTSVPALPNSSYFQGSAINNSGQVAGSSYMPGINQWHGFLYTPNVGTVDIGTMGGYATAVNDINGSGVVVGSSGYDDTDNRRAFVYADGVMRDLGTLGGLNSDVSAINDHGVAVGSAEVATGGSVAVMYKDGQITRIGDATLPCHGMCWDGSYASDINNAGKVVGSTTEFNGQWIEPFLYENGVMHNLNTMIAPGWDLSFALAINDQDQILALGYSPDSVYQYVLLTPTGANILSGPEISPVPEPRQTVSLLAGICLLGFFGGRQRRRSSGEVAPGLRVSSQRICV